MLPPPLPAVEPITAELRLTYVLRHFREAYYEMPLVSIGYAATRPQVEVTAICHDFFAGTTPYPQPPEWREWAGRRLPFFFDDKPNRPLLELLPEGRARLNADVVSAAFYLLSGWQEFFSEERDQHGRFPYAASVQARYGFVAVPVVNYYFDVLKTAVEHVAGHPLHPPRWAGGATWAAFITHDIDNLYSAWKEPTKAALRRGNLPEFGRQLWRHFTRQDAWNNLALVRQTVAEYGAKSTFFFLPEHRKATNGTPNADYSLQSVKDSVAALAAAGAEIQLHASLGTATDAAQLDREVIALARLPGTEPGIRFHYLQWEPRLTPFVVDDLAFEYDSTLGFAEHYGFRNSYCLPFQPFDFRTGQAHDFLEIPLNVMDATLHHPRYLQLAPDEILPALTPMFQEIERFGGVCTVLWHNENFDPANQRNGPEQFRTILEYLRGRNVAFVNGQDVWEQLYTELG
ncbi:DUF7033 domain-containing protein [Hymenobacter actinosclerus]|uniref:DUF7033 domain-containing protein n=1 Tax=Hymenobacter actinosclerus TaxID=82805 RepID=A0A1I0F1K3_9BACT|nr:hypothetical protein [Hymenobacter actinosclerus]SET51863.1 hypothetical protein SAMN04487998_2085 [Hymenobacter actinosclerus]